MGIAKTQLDTDSSYITSSSSSFSYIVCFELCSCIHQSFLFLPPFYLFVPKPIWTWIFNLLLWIISFFCLLCWKYRSFSVQIFQPERKKILSRDVTWWQTRDHFWGIFWDNTVSSGLLMLAFKEEPGEHSVILEDYEIISHLPSNILTNATISSFHILFIITYRTQLAAGQQHLVLEELHLHFFFI